MYFILYGEQSPKALLDIDNNLLTFHNAETALKYAESLWAKAEVKEINKELTK